jgi:ankyrin repeat protein
LIEAGADLAVVDHNGYTALDAAAWNGQANSLQVLLEAAPEMLYHRGADGNNLLHRVCMGGSTIGHEKVLEQLLERGLSAEISSSDAEPVSPLFLVAASGSGKMVDLLCANNNSSMTAGVDAAGAWVHRAWRRCQQWAGAQDFSAYETTSEVVRAVADCKLSHGTLADVAASAGVAVDWQQMKLSTPSSGERPVGYDIFMHGLQSSKTFFSNSMKPDEEESCEAANSSPKARAIEDWGAEAVQDWYHREVLPQMPPGYWGGAAFAALEISATDGAELSSLDAEMLASRLEQSIADKAAVETSSAAEVASLMLRKRDEAVERGATVLEWSFRQRTDWILYDADDAAALERCRAAYVRSTLLEPEATGSNRFCNLTREDTVLQHDMENLVRYRPDAPLRQTGVRRDVRPGWARPVAKAPGEG